MLTQCGVVRTSAPIARARPAYHRTGYMCVQLRISRGVEGAGHLLVLHAHLHLALVQGLAGLDNERDAVPALVVDVHHHGGAAYGGGV